LIPGRLENIYTGNEEQIGNQQERIGIKNLAVQPQSGKKIDEQYLLENSENNTGLFGINVR